MKVFNLALVSLAMASSLTAHAIVRIGWERPLYMSDLKELDDAGHENRLQLNSHLMMNKQDGAVHATSLSYSEHVTRYCFRAPCPQINTLVNYKIVDVSSSNGLNIYQAIETTEAHRLGGHRTGHATLIENPSLASWTLTTDDGERVRHFEGTYNPVYTIQGTGGVQ